MSRKVSSIALILLFFLNLVDAFATHYWVTNGFANELNPIMDLLLRVSPPLFLIIKIIIGSACIWILWEARTKKMVKMMIVPLVVVYTIITALHFRIFFQVLNQ